MTGVGPPGVAALPVTAEGINPPGTVVVEKLPNFVLLKVCVYVLSRYELAFDLGSSRNTEQT